MTEVSRFILVFYRKITIFNILKTSLMKNLYTLLVALLISFTINAQIIDIPDAVFKYRLVNQMCVDTNGSGNADSDVDTNNDGEIQVTEAEAVLSLILNDPIPNEIISIEGIEAFSNLQVLYIHNNDIISVELSSLTNLTELWLFYTDLTSLDVSSLTNLTKLICSQNQISDLNVDGLTNLEYINCQSNQLSSLDLSSLSNLTYLSCGNNNLTSINLNNLAPLESLGCSNNPLTALDINNFITLETLACTNNQLTELDVSNLTALKYLYCSDNQLTGLEASNLVNMETLKCSNNQLTAMDVSNMPNLEILECDNNQLTSLEFNTEANLTDLHCFNNQIESLDVSNCTNLEELLCADNQISELNLSNNPILASLNIRNNQISSLDFSNHEVSFYSFSASNNALISINFKNGIEDVDYFDTEPDPPYLGLYFANNPDLNFLCVDEFELNQIDLIAELNGIDNYAINTYCSFSPGGEYYTIEGNTTIDIDNDGCDPIDAVYSHLNFAITNGSETGNFISNSTGYYNFAVQEGSHTITPNLENPNYFNVSPTEIIVSFPTDASPYLQDFCITPNGTFNDLEITIIPLQAARPGFDTDYKLIYKNKGTTTLSGSVDLSFEDDLMDFVSVSPTEDAQAANMLIWNFTDLNPFESRVILFTMNINSPMDTPPVNGDEVLAFGATINSSETDETPDDNTSTLNQTVVNSFDPNDKTCLEGDVITPEMVGDYVHYMIRFENTGTASAVNIVVKDDIDRTKYDLSSLIAIDASHDFVARIKDDGSDYFVEFIFENINLPFDDANNDGYIVFKIKTLDTLVLGDTFENNAEIYFDFNFPIITNFAETSIATLSTEDFELANNAISLYPNPTTHSLHLESKQAIQYITMYDISGRIIKDIAVIGTKTELTMSTEALSTGTYFVKIKTIQGETVRKVIKD